MTALKDRFWAKVLFSQFIKHYRKMTPEQKVADIDASMDALEDLDDTGDSFGAKMVRWSMERVNQYPQASENGKKGGRPRKNQETTADAPTREDGEFKSDSGDAGNLESATSANIYGDAAISDDAEACTCRESGRSRPTTVSNNSENGGSGTSQARESRRTGAEPRGVSHSAPVRLPTFDEFNQFVDQQGLDYTDAREWWEMTMVDRDGKDRDGKPIANWKGALKRFCTTKTANRRSA